MVNVVFFNVFSIYVVGLTFRSVELKVEYL